PAAFRWARAAYELAPTDPSVVEALETAANSASAYEELAALYLARIEHAEADEQLALRRKVAAIYGERLGRRDESIAQLSQILEVTPKDAEAVAVLDRLYRAAERHEDLHALYQHRLEHVEDEVDRHGLLHELAALEETTLGFPEDAATHYREALSL